MPLPQEQLNHLEMSLRQHQEELQSLESGSNANQPDIRARVEFHKAVLSIGRNDRIRAALSELCDNPQLIDQLTREPKAFLNARAIDLPPGAVRVVAGKRAPGTVMAGVNFRIAGQEFSLLWDREGGFGARMVTTKP